MVARRRFFVLAAIAALGGCATLAGGGGGDTDLPNAGVGPFRKLKAGELGNSRAAPYAIDDGGTFVRDPSVLDADGDPKTLPAWGYFAASLAKTATVDAPPDAIVRYDAEDGRSFARAGKTVLAPEASWEGGTVGAPSVIRVRGAIFLYYAAAGGIGLARGSDGVSFTREPAPVLAPEANWETNVVPRSPGAVVLPDGSVHLFYEVDAGIGEATSTDGVHFTRVGDGPALAPGGGNAPFAITGQSGEGRPILRLYYSVRAYPEARTIDLAARFLDDDSSFVRAATPVFGTGESLQPTEPCVVQHDGFAFLFTTELAGKTNAKQYPAVAAGVAPALASLPPPSP